MYGQNTETQPNITKNKSGYLVTDIIQQNENTASKILTLLRLYVTMEISKAEPTWYSPPGEKARLRGGSVGQLIREKTSLE